MNASAFLNNTGLSRSERAGLALREWAKTAPISFGSAILPRVDLSGDERETGFHFSAGVRFGAEPEAAAYRKLTAQPMTEDGRALDDAGARQSPARPLGRLRDLPPGAARTGL